MDLPPGAGVALVTETAQVRGKYAPLARLATGGMAEILLARFEGAQGFEKLVVLKRLLPHLAHEQRHVSMFLDEARTVARISHPNVCQVNELGEEHGRYIIVMEYLEGVTFGRVTAALPAAKGAFELRLVAELFRQACEGLHHAHELRALDGTPAGLVHRDISPQNLLVTVDGVVKVLDFGIAKTSWSTTPTRAGMVLGKIAYMSPEQVRGLRVDRRSDLFSLGVVLHELLVRRWLYRRETDFLTYRAITEKDAPDVRELEPDLPAALAEVVAQALARDPAARPATARELGERVVDAVAPYGGPLRSSEVSAWMAEQFGHELGERRDRVVDAIQQRARAARRLASYSEDGSDDLPTVQFDTDIDPSPGLQAPPRPLLLAPARARATPPLPLAPPEASAELVVPTVAATARARLVTGPSAADREAQPAPIAAVPARPEPPVSGSLSLQLRAPRRRGRLWLALGALAAAAAIGFVWQGGGLPEVKLPFAAVAVDAAPIVAVAPPAPPPAGADAGSVRVATEVVVEPLTPADAAPPPGPAPTPAALAEDAPAEPPADRPPVADDAPASPHRPRDRRPGFLTIDSKPYATLYVDGRNVGPTPLMRLPLAPGAHRVRAVTASGHEQRFRVTIEPGREATRRRLEW